jgi:hypothetical protein
MTVGSWNRDAFTNHPASGGWYGIKWYKTWSGTDQAGMTPRQNHPTQYYTAYRNGRPIRFRVRNASSPKPKRARFDEHDYVMESFRLTDELTGILRSDGSVYTACAMHQCAVGTWAPATLLDANDQIRLVGKLREKMLGSDFNPSEFLGEGRQTLGLITDSATRIFRSYKRLKKGDLAGAARHLLDGTGRKPHVPYTRMKPFLADSAAVLSRKWLEIQYGWLPLLKDSQAAAEALAHHCSVPFQQTYRMSVRKESNLTRVSSPTGFKSSTCTSTRSHSRSLKVIVREKLSVMAALGLSDPETVAWELMPWSFVADWFIPIGSYLEARGFSSHIVGSFVTSDLKIGRNGPIKNGGNLTSNPRAWYSGVVFSRTVSAAPNVPLPTFKPLGKSLSWSHCVNAVALLVSSTRT